MSQKLLNASVIGQDLAVLFNDGVEIYLSLEKVRRACPCAKCQGEPDVMGKYLYCKVDYRHDSFELIKIQSVGGYAFQLYWTDGHSSGIYSYDYLRLLAAVDPRKAS
jgi:DUF971 family protein